MAKLVLDKDMTQEIWESMSMDEKVARRAAINKIMDQKKVHEFRRHFGRCKLNMSDLGELIDSPWNIAKLMLSPKAWEKYDTVRSEFNKILVQRLLATSEAEGVDIGTISSDEGLKKYPVYMTLVNESRIARIINDLELFVQIYNQDIGDKS